jgi:putative transposase
MLADHVHMLVSIPPKYAVSQVVGYMKGKSAIWIARNHFGWGRDYRGYHFWARGYFVTTVGIDEEALREYIGSTFVGKRTRIDEWINCDCWMTEAAKGGS